VRLDSGTLGALLGGTVVTTLLLAAPGGGHPLQKMTWILCGVASSMLTRGYGAHVSAHEEVGGVRYVVGFIQSVAGAWPVAVAGLPTVLLLLLAAAFDWPDDRVDPGDRVTIGYTTIGLNINVVLLFLLGVMAARRAGLPRVWTVLIGIFNALLGWGIVAVNLALN
jgi:hypothetical protein